MHVGLEGIVISPSWRPVAGECYPRSVHLRSEITRHRARPEQTGLTVKPVRIGDVEDER
ncbi:MAG: hypothetical protein K0R68_2709, partial [Mycobacterium sp.]|nr:hypothetical protein [Mycobacterium sp.]